MSHEAKYFFRLIITERRATVNPNTNPMLAILEPIIFPTAIPDLPSKVAFKLTINSGAEVPKETIVIPISNGDTLNLFAKPTALLTRRSPPTTSRIIPVSYTHLTLPTTSRV